MLEAKKSGHRQSGPQETSEKLYKSTNKFTCEQCNCDLESKGLLDAHVQSSHVNMKEFACGLCDLLFLEKSDVEKHVADQHPAKSPDSQWNCNDCAFQGNE